MQNISLKNYRLGLSLCLGISLLCTMGCPAEEKTETATDTPKLETTAPAEITTAPAETPATTTSGESIGPPPPPEGAEAPSAPTPFKSSGKVQKTASGLQYDDMTVGTGPAPKSGQYVKVHYVGTLEDGTEFDASYKRNKPFEFQIGQGSVIKAWDEGVMTMKVGGRRKLIVPPDLGYGETGTPGGPIPPNATLNFDVELLGVSDTPTEAGM
jgi:peptidylprolyl isomerase